MSSILQEQATGRTIQVGGQKHLFFGGTAYLGLNNHPDFIALFIEGLHKYGLNNGTSRTNNVQLHIYQEAEQHAAQKFGFESALLLSSGFLAAQLTVQTITAGGAGVYYSPSCHPALRLYAGGRHSGHSFSPKSQPVDQWVQAIVAEINASQQDSFVIISNTIDNVIPTRHNFSGFDTILPTKNIHFILDDSHGLGVYHPDRTSVHTGQLLPALGDNIKITVVASMAKGMGIDAGIVLGDKHTLNTLTKSPIYIGASPSAPAFLHTFVHGEHIYQSQWHKLRDNIQFFLSQIRKDQFNFLPDYPVFQLKNPESNSEMRFFDTLFDRNIVISSFPYPDPNDIAVERIVLSAVHEKTDLKELGDALRQ